MYLFLLGNQYYQLVLDSQVGQGPQDLLQVPELHFLLDFPEGLGAHGIQGYHHPNNYKYTASYLFIYFHIFQCACSMALSKCCPMLMLLCSSSMTSFHSNAHKDIKISAERSVGAF